MTSLEVNLFDNESKSSRSKVALQRPRRYVSAAIISRIIILPVQNGILTVAVDVGSDFCQRITYRRIGIEQVVMFMGVPLGQGWELLRDREEQVDNDSDWS